MATSERRRVVLIATEDGSTRSAVQRFLGRTGYDALAAASTDHALEIILAATPDVVLYSTRLAGSETPEVVRQAHRARARLPVVLICGIDESQIAVEGLKAGARDYLLTPIDFEELELILDRALAAHAAEVDRLALSAAIDAYQKRLANIGSLTSSLLQSFDSSDGKGAEHHRDHVRSLISKIAHEVDASTNITTKSITDERRT